MLASDVVEVVREIAATDPATCDAAAADVVLAAGLHRVRCWLDAVDAAVVRSVGRVGARRVVAGHRERQRCIDRTGGGLRRRCPEVHCGVGGRDAVGGSRRRHRPGRPTGSMITSGSSWRRGAEPGRAGGDDVGRRVRPQGPRPRPPHLPRRGPAPPREAAAQRSVKRWMDRQGMCHTQISLDPEADARLVSRVRRRRRRREGQARRRPHASTSSRPTPSWRWSPPRRSPGARRHAELLDAHRPRHPPHRPPRGQRLRDVRRPTAPTSHRPAFGVRGRHHPGRVGRRRQRRRRRTSQTPRHRRSTPSTPSDAPDLRRTRLPRPLRRLRHPPPQRMEPRRPDQPRRT